MLLGHQLVEEECMSRVLTTISLVVGAVVLLAAVLGTSVVTAEERPVEIEESVVNQHSDSGRSKGLGRRGDREDRTRGHPHIVLGRAHTETTGVDQLAPVDHGHGVRLKVPHHGQQSEASGKTS